MVFDPLIYPGSEGYRAKLFTNCFPSSRSSYNGKWTSEYRSQTCHINLVNKFRPPTKWEITMISNMGACSMKELWQYTKGRAISSLKSLHSNRRQWGNINLVPHSRALVTFSSCKH